VGSVPFFFEWVTFFFLSALFFGGISTFRVRDDFGLAPLDNRLFPSKVLSGVPQSRSWPPHFSGCCSFHTASLYWLGPAPPKQAPLPPCPVSKTYFLAPVAQRLYFPRVVGDSPALAVCEFFWCEMAQTLLLPFQHRAVPMSSGGFQHFPLGPSLLGFLNPSLILVGSRVGFEVLTRWLVQFFFSSPFTRWCTVDHRLHTGHDRSLFPATRRSRPQPMFLARFGGSAF